MQEIEIPPMGPERFRSVLSPERFEEFERRARETRELLAGRAVWNINSTARGGGVVELLRPLIAYARGAGVDARWMVIDGTPAFFALTKRIHNRLHGAAGDGGPLDDAARQVYEQVLAENLAALQGRVHEGDVVIVHDPQPAGLIAALKRAGAAVIWRCHVGIESPNDIVREAWAFLRPYILPADACVFSREAFVWEGLDRDRIAVIHPSIDPLAPKNEDLPPDVVPAVLRACGLLAADGAASTAVFERIDGTPGRVERRAQVVEDQPLREGVPAVLQVSRWDALKDPIGVIRGFAEHVPAATGAHLVYAGPSAEAVADDPEGLRMLQESIAFRDRLPAEQRSRIHLASLPMEDPDENAIIVNALQRHASVVVQKSLAEGFGLTVAEAMWKARPVVASRIGGIQEQIVHGESGILLDDPRDLAAFGAAIGRLLADPEEASRMGQRGRERVRERFTSVRSLLDYAALIERLVDGPLANVHAPESVAAATGATR
ncbi:MAG: trehalose synthase [Solirubrobacteraceae bacterium]|nr:trehalose synthase [Solirubrobacteraceae bacterium]